MQDGLRRERRRGTVPGDVALPPPLGEDDHGLDRVADRALHFDTIGGRTTAFLPDVQKKTGGTPAAKPSAKPASKKKRAAKKPPAAKKRRTSPRNLSK